MKLLGSYKNGNTRVKIYDDGTKIRRTSDNEFRVDFPESFDCKITNYCDANCLYCHEKSNTDGQHGDLNIKLFKTLMPYTEIAIGGGNPLSHPDLISFLTNLRELNVIPSITVNQMHIKRYKDMILKLLSEKLIFGLGISLVNSSSQEDKELIESFGNNVVIHVINGIFSEKDMEFIKDKKILILGYKTFGRGIDYRYKYGNDSIITTRMKWLKENLKKISEHCSVCSFDNLSIEQLNIKEMLSPSDWEKYYQGDDGSHTMYYDAVTKTAAKSSTVDISERIINDSDKTLKDLFGQIKK